MRPARESVEGLMWCAWVVMVWVVVTATALVQVPPLPGDQPARATRNLTRGLAVLLMEREARKATNNIRDTRSASLPTTNVVTLAADFAPTGLGNLTAFFEVTQDFTNWTRFEQPYPFSGGTLTQGYTNTTGMFFWRAGYTIN